MHAKSENSGLVWRIPRVWHSSLCSFLGSKRAKIKVYEIVPGKIGKILLL